MPITQTGNKCKEKRYARVLGRKVDRQESGCVPPLGVHHGGVGRKARSPSLLFVGRLFFFLKGKRGRPTLADFQTGRRWPQPTRSRTAPKSTSALVQIRVSFVCYIFFHATRSWPWSVSFFFPSSAFFGTGRVPFVKRQALTRLLCTKLGSAALEIFGRRPTLSALYEKKKDIKSMKQPKWK